MVVVISLLVGAAAPPRADAATTVTGTQAQLLARLRTLAEHPAGYARTLFVHWIDADRDGCDTRREVLIAESRTTVRVGTGCSLSGGSWRSAYDGITTTSASSFDIDHVVPLKEAWDSGAWAWSSATRRAYANDLGDSRTLRAVSATSNRAKGDADPAQWLPPLSTFRCTYAAEWIAVKVRWRLAVDSVERTALGRLVARCPVRTSSVTLASVAYVSTSAPAPSPTPASGCDPNYTGYCVPIVSYDLDCSDIQHRVQVVGVDIHRFDGDGDRIGCESYPA